jgi:hypothetical protein
MIKFVYFDLVGCWLIMMMFNTKVVQDFNLDRDEFGKFYRDWIDDYGCGES